MLDGFREHDECKIIERQIVPNAVDLARLFGPLKILGVGCDVSNALSHLRSAKRVLWKLHMRGRVGNNSRL